jgi:hypothetical protein
MSYAYAEQNHKFLVRMLSSRISFWCVCSVQASVLYAYAQHVLKGPFQACNFYAYVEYMCKELLRMLSDCICSVHTQLPDAYAQCTHKFLMRMLRARLSSCWCIVCSVHLWVPIAYAQRMHKFLMRMLSGRLSSCWCIVCSFQLWVTIAYAQRMHKFLMRMLNAWIRISSLCVRW